MYIYILTGTQIEEESSCGEDNSFTLFSEEFLAADDEAAISQAGEIIKRLETTQLKDAHDKDVQVTLSIHRTVRTFRYISPQEVQPAREAVPAKPARLV